MVVALKSLPSGTMLNIVGFGTTIKPLFTSSKLCTDVSLTQLAKNHVLFIRFPAKQITLFPITYEKRKTHGAFGSCFPKADVFSRGGLSVLLSNQAIGQFLGLP